MGTCARLYVYTYSYVYADYMMKFGLKICTRLHGSSQHGAYYAVEPTQLPHES